MNDTKITYSKFYISETLQLEFSLLKSTASNKKKQTIVMLYGLVCNNRHWSYQIDYFLNQGFDVLLHNYRFHFGSKCLEETTKCTFSEMANDLNLLLESIDLTNVILMGHSMGVNVAIEYCLTFPCKVSQLVLVSGNPMRPHDTMFETNMSYFTIPFMQNLNSLYPKWFNVLWTHAHKNSALRKIVLHGGFNPKLVEDQFVKYYMKKIGELDPEIFFQLLTEMKHHNLLSKLHLLNDKPTLVLGGDKDYISPIATQIILYKNIKNAQLYIVKEGSHVPQVDFPKSINERINLFLNNTISSQDAVKSF